METAALILRVCDLSDNPRSKVSQEHLFSSSFSLSNFEGSLELLLYLIQKEEMDICDIVLKEVTLQFFNYFDPNSIDRGTEFLSLATTLLLLKSRRLLPKGEEGANDVEEEEDPRFSLIHHLLEYCQFKEVAEGLSEREAKERFFFPRPSVPCEKAQGLGLNEVALQDLVTLLQDVMQRANRQPSALIADEEWSVASTIEWLQKEATHTSLAFHTLFSEEKCREELIVLFLALLELMKHQVLFLKREEETIWIEFNPFSSHASGI